MLQDTINVIQSLGFPVFCVLALGALVWKGFDRITTANQDREQKLYMMLGETREQLQKAIEVNASFVEILSDMRSDVASVQDDIVKIKTKLNMKKE